MDQNCLPIEIKVRQGGGDTYQGKNRRFNTWKSDKDKDEGMMGMVQRIRKELEPKIKKALLLDKLLRIKLTGSAGKSEWGIRDDGNIVTQMTYSAVTELERKVKKEIVENISKHMKN